MRTHAHHPQECYAPWKREGENVSSGEARADSFRRSQAPPRRLLTRQLCAGFLEHRAALGKQFGIIALPNLEVGTPIEPGQRPVADVSVETAEL
jgi:hypothetical protein